MGKTKDQLTAGQMTQTNLAGGLIAGMAAAVISQPADTLLSKINKTKGAPGQSTTSRLVQMAGQLGAKGLFTGMSARLVMIGTLTAGQCELFSLLDRGSRRRQGPLARMVVFPCGSRRKEDPSDGWLLDDFSITPATMT